MNKFRRKEDEVQLALAYWKYCKELEADHFKNSPFTPLEFVEYMKEQERTATVTVMKEWKSK